MPSSSKKYLTIAPSMCPERIPLPDGLNRKEEIYNQCVVGEDCSLARPANVNTISFNAYLDGGIP